MKLSSKDIKGEANILDPEQSGFRLGYGTEIAVVALIYDLLLSMDGRQTSVLIQLNTSAALNTVNLREVAGLMRNVLKWFKACLKEHT